MQKIRKVPSIEFPQNFKNFIWGPFWPKNFRAKSCPTKISCLNFNSACCCNFVQEWDALHRLTFDNTCKTSFLVNFGISFGQKTSEQSYSPQKNIWLNFKSLCRCNCAKKIRKTSSIDFRWWRWISLINCFDRLKVFSIISRQEHCQKSSSSGTSNMLRGFEPAKNPSLFFVEWSLQF